MIFTRLAGVLVLGASLLAHAAIGQTGFAPSNSGLGMKTIPTTTTALATGVLYVTAIHLTDPSGTSTTVSLYDGSTLIYSWPMGGSNPTTLDIVVPQGPISIANGLSWSSSAASSAMGQIAWTH